MFTSFFLKLKIGSKISILPILAIVGLITISIVNTHSRQKIGEMNSVIHKTHNAAITLTQQLHLESNYLSKPDNSLPLRIEEKQSDIFDFIKDSKSISTAINEYDLLNKIEEINKKHNEIFVKAKSIVLEIIDHQSELTALYHDSDNLAGQKVDEISLSITHLMIEGKTLSESKRELRNSLREFIGLTSNAMLNTNELLFFSNSERYEIAEKKRKMTFSLVTRACRALSVVTNDPSDEATWKKIDEKLGRIKELREHIFDHWQIRENLSEELRHAHGEIQITMQRLVDTINNETGQLISYYKKVNLITFGAVFFALVLSGFFIVRNITHPVQELTHGINDFKTGVAANITPKTQDEIGNLTSTFNKMIQHRQKVEKKLLKSETRFRQLAENINEVFWIVSPDWKKVIYISPAYENVWGLSCESLYEKPDHWIDSIQKDDVVKVTNYIKTKSSGDLSEIVFPEYRIIRPDGTIRWILARGFPVYNDDGKVYRIVGIAEDITEQKQLNRDIQTLFKTTAGITGKDFFNNVVKLLCDWLECEVASIGELYKNGSVNVIAMVADGHLSHNYSYDLIGSPCEMVRKEGFCHYARNISAIFPEDKSLVELKADGYIGTQIVSSEGNVIGVLNALSRNPLARPKRAKEVLNIIAARVSAEIERKNYEIDKEKMEKQLFQSQKMEAIGTLAGGIAHDFNNILFPIVGYAEMLQEDLPQNSQHQKNVSEIFSAALRARDLVQQILTFSRQSDQEVKPIRLQSILKETLKLLRPSIPQTIDIRMDVDSDCDCILADSTQIHQVIMNLCTNAYHAMQDSGGQLVIVLKQIELDTDQNQSLGLLQGRYALLKVIDTGTGIKEELMERLFDPYFTTKGIGKGTGLGLSVVQGIVKSFHGNIQIQSEQRKGTTVSVYLPTLKKGSKQLLPEQTHSIMNGTETILLVDDEEPIMRMEQEALERLGYQVIARTGSVEALEAFKSKPDKYDLILTDMTMPNMTGIQLSKEIKSIKKEIPVMICTGYSDQIDEESFEEFGIEGYVLKPLAIGELSHKIREILDKVNYS